MTVATAHQQNHLAAKEEQKALRQEATHFQFEKLKKAAEHAAAEAASGQKPNKIRASSPSSRSGNEICNLRLS